MFFSYLSTALHSLRKQPVFSIIKILSLTLGLAASMLVVMHVQYAQTSNTHIADRNNTYRMLTHMKMREINLPYRTFNSSDAMVTDLVADFGSEMPYLARIRYTRAIFSRGNDASENEMTWAEPDAVYLLDLRFLAGDAATALDAPGSVILSQKAATKYFGTANPMGLTLTLNDATDLRVTGLVEDQPLNATHGMEIIVSRATGAQIFGDNFMSGSAWLSFQGTHTFLTLPPGRDPEWFNANVPAFFDRHMPDDFRSLANALDYNISLQPITDIYLNPFDNFASPDNTRVKTVLLGLVLFAVLILATSCINYVNLSLSQIGQRSKEIGVRKTLGATRLDIIYQFLLESMLLTIIALLIALPIVAVLLPVYTNLTATEIVFADMFKSSLALLLLGVALITGLIAGIVPALSISRVEAVRALKGVVTQDRLGRFARAAVTASQFTISTALILLAIATYVQISYLQQMDVGFEKEGLVMLDTRYSPQEEDAFNYDAMRNEMAQHPSISAVAAANFLAPSTPPLFQWRSARSDPDDTVSVIYAGVSAGFAETWGLELLAGRTFSEQFPADFYPPSSERKPSATYGIMITDLAAQRFGLGTPEQALNEIVMMTNLSFRVIGVVKRFQLTSGMESEQRSVGVMMGIQTPMRALHIRIDPLQVDAAMAHIDQTWANHRGTTPINRYFYAQSLSDVIVRRNNGLSVASLAAAVITIIIAAMGLFALASYASARRTKEVGIRKVLGASSASLVRLLAWDFVRPVLIACLVAWPIAWYCIDLMYRGFAQTAPFPFIWYIGVTAGIVILAFATVAIQCYRVASADPVHSLRYE